MLPIILLILKIIGILFIILTGCILLVLFVPVRYGVKGNYKEQFNGMVRISWLLHILSITVSYENELRITCKILGIKVGKRKKKDQKDSEPDLVSNTEPQYYDETELDAEEDILISAQEWTEKEPEHLEEHFSEKKKKKRKPGINWAQKKHQFLFRYKSIRNKIITGIKKKETLTEYFSDRENKEMFAFLIKKLKGLFKHIFPKRGQGIITFGFDDPYLTGQILTFCSFLYPFICKGVKITPVFDHQILEADLQLKGRICFGILIWYGISFYFNKTVRKTLNFLWKR